MILSRFTLLFLMICFHTLCNSQDLKIDMEIFKKVKSIEDSITVGHMRIHNAFKFQILAHENNSFDSIMILENVYQPNQNIFDNHLSQIFGDLGVKFQPNGICEWNNTLLKNNNSSIRESFELLDAVNIDSLFTKTSIDLQENTGQDIMGSWLIYMGPKDFNIAGGFDDNSFVLDMFSELWNSVNIAELIAHEMMHMTFHPILSKDPNGNNGLGITLDEGLAVYYPYIYLNMSIEEALFDSNTKILFEREKEIFQTLESYLFKNETEGCPVFRHCGRSYECEPIIENLPEDIVDNVCYFIGFRIIQKYVEKYGENAWKDIFKIPLKDFYEKSRYKEYIESK